MREVGTGLGVYVVVWMGTGNAAARYRPLWKSPKDALEDLEDLARAVMAASPEPMDIRCTVIDASLPLTVKRGRSARKARRGAATSSRRPRTASKPPMSKSGKPRKCVGRSSTPSTRKPSSTKDGLRKAKKKARKKPKKR